VSDPVDSTSRSGWGLDGKDEEDEDKTAEDAEDAEECECACAG